MGQKTNALGLRLKKNKSWVSPSFYSIINYKKNINLDIIFYKFLKGLLLNFSLDHNIISIKRLWDKVVVTIIFYNQDYMFTKHNKLLKKKKNSYS